MIEVLDNLPDNVLAIMATGRVTNDDYQAVVAPVVAAKRVTHPVLRLLYHVPHEFKMFATTALWDDAQIGLQHLRGFERIAVVTDIEWLKTLAGGIRPEEPVDVRIFPNAEIDAARDWICA